MVEKVINVMALSRSFSIRDKEARKAHWFSKPIMKTQFAVSDLNLEIQKGEKVAFIGPNGAGKSTTLKMLCGLLRPTAGQARVCGFVPWDDTRELARHIGLVFGQRSHLWPILPVRDSFDLLARIYDLDETAYRDQRDRLVALFGLSKLMDQLARTLSLGQRMRADIAAALLHRPSVLFLDEPTIGLDVTAKALLRDHLNALARETDTTILLTSHDTDDIEKICRRVVLIDKGQKLLDTTLSALQRTYNRFKTLRLTTEEAEPDLSHSGVMVEERGEHRLVLKIDLAEISVERVVSYCLSHFTIRDIGIEGMPLEEIIRAIYLGKVAA